MGESGQKRSNCPSLLGTDVGDLHAESAVESEELPSLEDLSPDSPPQALRLGALIESLAISALIAGIPVPIAGTIALTVATPTTSLSIYQVLKVDRTPAGAVNVIFLFLAWAMLPCLLIQQMTYGLSEELLRLTVILRVFAAIDIWCLSTWGDSHP